MSNYSNYSSSREINNTPIYHWDFVDKKCTDQSNAEKWTWKCIEKLARFFCAVFCDHSLCSDEFNKFDLDDVTDLDNQWIKLQHDLHKALSYLSICKDNYCPACAVTTALAYFPTLIKLSEIKPISTLKMNAVDAHPEIVYQCPVTSKSLPCYEIRTLYDEGYSTEIIIRENALLQLDLNDLPPLPPWEPDELKSNLRKGQLVLYLVYPEKNNDMYKSLNQLNDEEEQEFQCYLNTAIAATAALQEYFELRYYFPNAMDKQEINTIYSTIMDTLTKIFEKKGYDLYPLLSPIPSIEQTTKYPKVALLKSALLLRHKSMSSDDVNNNIAKGLEKAMIESQEKALKPIPDIIKQLQIIKLYRCLLPKPENDSTFKEPQRYFQMFIAYWGIIRNIIIKTLSSSVHYQPNPLLPLIKNIKERIDLCISNLNHENLKEPQETINKLVDILLGDDMDDYHAVPEFFNEQINLIDLSLEKVKYTIKPKEYPLISAEKTFIDYVESEFKKYFLKCENAYTDTLNNLKEENIQNKCNNNVQDSVKNTTSSPIIPDNNCDTSQSTLLNYWTTEGGNALKISTYTNGIKDGEAAFGLYQGCMSKQQSFMTKIVETKKLTVSEIINLCYSVEKINLRGDKEGLLSLLGLVRSLVSDIRKKLTAAKINREIITPLGQNIDAYSAVILKVKHTNNLDEKNFKCKDMESYIPPEELISNDDKYGERNCETAEEFDDNSQDMY